LVILSLQHVLDQAVTELLVIGKELLIPLEGDRAWISHGESLDYVVASYHSLLSVLRDKLKSASRAVAQVVLAATMDIAYTFRFLDDTKTLQELDQDIFRYTVKGHHGMAYILLTRRLQYNTNPMDHDIEDMMNTRNSFINSIGDVIERQDLKEDLWIDLAETQLFIPGVLFQIPSLAKAVVQDGRRDCLWRPVGHILHDNKVHANFRFSSYDDGYDILGRSRLHIACALDADEQHVPDLLLLPRLAWPDAESLGLNALHIAAMHGNTYIFRNATACGHDVAHSSDMHPSSHTGRTYLHWAAYFGHIELIEYIFHRYVAKKDLFMDLLVCRDRRGDTALHLAARNGHTDVVEAILGQTDWIRMKSACLRHTPFWAATTGQHLEVMKLLEPLSNVDEDEAGGLTPLAEAARQGFLEGVEYLLKLVGVASNSINNCWDDKANKTVLRTPLDLAADGKHDDCVKVLEQHGALKWRDLSLSG
jgi:ankyrin repeat protein